jgi:predicted TIM-barrel fold metal-dependent hydrolase
MRCDSHVHVVGPADRYPQSPTRTYLAETAPLDKLRELAAVRQVERFVIVQPSFYGADNTVLLESLATLGGHGRGVAVVTPRQSLKPPSRITPPAAFAAFASISTAPRETSTVPGWRRHSLAWRTSRLR